MLGSDRVPTNATPGELAQIWQNHTAVQAKKLSECYIGTWMEISGPVYDVRNAMITNEIRLTIEGVEGVMLIHCTFQEQWEQRCLVLRKGDAVRVLGQVSDFNQVSVSLEECEFV